MRMPPRAEHALPQDEINVLAFPDTEADAYVHLRPYDALAHRLLRRALSRGDQRDRDGPAATRDRVGFLDRVRCVVGEFGVLIDDDQQRGEFGIGLPYSASGLGEPRGSRLEDGHGITQQHAGLVGCGSQTIDAGGPWPEFHAAFEVDAPDDYVAAGGQVAQQDVDAAALSRASGATE